MTRRLLAVATALGLLVSAIGFTGIYANLSDTATIGPNQMGTTERARAADLKVASDAGGSCGTFVDSIDAAVFSGYYATSPDWRSSYFLCLKNAGISDLAVRLAISDLTDTDPDCTGDEEEAGDTTCGGGGVGEASSVLRTEVVEVDCATLEVLGTEGGATLAALRDYVPQAGTFEAWDPGMLAAGSTTCWRLTLHYPAIGDGVTETQAQIAQTDLVNWTWAFVGSVE